MTLRLNLLRWLVTLVGTQLFCGVAWVLGPLLPLLEPWPARAVLAMLLLLVWAGSNILLDVLASRRDAALSHGVVGPAAEATAVGGRLAAALAAMRKAKGRQFRLYDQPWYAIIGPPGAGKTTALMNAGLVFPGQDTAALGGVGGTRLCDWWFTDAAVLIDTAGRYTTQDSSAEVDRAGWQAFLDLLRRTRPRQPLNGVIVAIALNDVAAEASAAAHATAIRARIDELEDRLGVRMPVYAMFTKADLLPGFTEFFDDLDRGARDQVWGATFPPGAPPDPGAALRPLLDRLDRRLLMRLDGEPGPERRALIAGFPAQLAAVLPQLRSFAAAAFGPGPAGKSPLLRGLFLTSGTQEGTPIDRLVGGLSRAFGVDPGRAVPLRPVSGRSYFLGSLLREIVFPEAPLVGYRPGAARRRMVFKVTGFVACAALAAACVALLLTDRAAQQGAVGQAQAATTRQQALAATLPLDPVADAVFAVLLPWLDAAASHADAPASVWPGLAQGEKLAAASDVQYRHALEFALLPRLVWRLEAQMRGLMEQPEQLYEATRIYLMLGGARTPDTAVVLDWFRRDWATTLSGEAAPGQRDALTRHLSALLAEPLPPVTLDGPLVASARAVIGRVPLAARAWSRLKPLADASGIPPWTPAAALGSAGVSIFLRLSGLGLEQGIPGLYTAEGARRAVLPALPRAAQEAADESWVLGTTPVEAGGAAATAGLQAEVLALYSAEYVAAWDAMLADLDPAPLRNMMQAAQDLFLFSSSRSPIRSVLASAVQQLAPGAAAGAPGLDAVDRHFAALRAVFGTGGTVPINQVLRPLADLEQELAKRVASNRAPAPSAVGEDPAAALRSEAFRQPQPLNRWLTSLATSGASLRDGGPRGAMIAAWNAAGGPGATCPRVIGGKYPFVASATADVPTEDFTRLLGPGGAIDAFFNTQLKPFVDTGSRPWKLHPVDGVNAPVTAADVAQFQRAADIRALFFPAGSAVPLVRFDVTPGTLDAGSTNAVLDMGAAPVTAARDATSRPVALVWPARPRPATAARLVVNGPAPYTVEVQGPWAAFRLAAAAKATTAGDRTTLTFSGNDHTARFDIRATPNPFASTALTEFRCPAVQ